MVKRLIPDSPDYPKFSGGRLVAAAVELRRPLRAGQGRDELVQVAVQNLIELVQGQVDAVVRDSVLLEVVSTDLLRAVAGPDHAPPLGADRLLLLGELHLVEACAQHAQSLLSVLQLRLLVLDADREPGRLVGDANRRVSRVHALAARAGRGRGLDL